MVILLINVAVALLALNLAVVVTSTVTMGFRADADALGAATTALQTETPPRGLPRAISFLTMGTFGVMPFGAVAAGAVIDATSDQFVLVVSAVACVLAGAVSFLLIRRTAL